MFDLGAIKALLDRPDFSMLQPCGVTGPYAKLFCGVLGQPASCRKRGSEGRLRGHHADPNLTYAVDLTKKMGVDRLGSRRLGGRPLLGAASDGDGDRNMISVRAGVPIDATRRVDGVRRRRGAAPSDAVDSRHGASVALAPNTAFTVTPSDSLACWRRTDCIPFFAARGGIKAVAVDAHVGRHDGVAQAKNLACLKRRRAGVWEPHGLESFVWRYGLHALPLRGRILRHRQ